MGRPRAESDLRGNDKKGNDSGRANYIRMNTV
jgi:hypothetical protein